MNNKLIPLNNFIASIQGVLPLLQKQAYDVDRCLLLPGAWLSVLAIAASGRFLELDDKKTNYNVTLKPKQAVIIHNPITNASVNLRIKIKYTKKN